MESVSTIVTQFGEFVIYENLTKLGIMVDWEDGEVDEETGFLDPKYELVGTDVSGIDIPMGIYDTKEEAEQAMRDLYHWLDHKAYAVYELSPPSRDEA